MYGYSLFQLYANYFKDLVRCMGIYGRDNGFGEKFNWCESYEMGLEQAQAENKPIMMIVHKSWCNACRNLRPLFASSGVIHSLSENFVMINLMDDQEPESLKFAPDGKYIPRILFISPQGWVYTDIVNERGNPKYKYYYSRTEPIIESMQRVLKRYDTKSK